MMDIKIQLYVRYILLPGMHNLTASLSTDLRTLSQQIKSFEHAYPRDLTMKKLV